MSEDRERDVIYAVSNRSNITHVTIMVKESVRARRCVDGQIAGRVEQHSLTFKSLFLIKNYLLNVNTYTSVPYSRKIVHGQPILLHNTRCARGHGATSPGDGRYSSEKMGTKERIARGVPRH
jgi:hypothetical protein